MLHFLNSQIQSFRIRRFFKAITEKQTVKVEKMLKSHPELANAHFHHDVFKKKWISDGSALFAARYHTKIAELLVQHGADTHNVIDEHLDSLWPYGYFLSPHRSRKFHNVFEELENNDPFKIPRESWEVLRNIDREFLKWLLSKGTSEETNELLRNWLDNFVESGQHDIEGILCQHLEIKPLTKPERLAQPDETEKLLCDYWRHLDIEWWRHEDRTSAVCDYCNCEIKPNEGYLIGSRLACEDCCHRLVSGAKQNLARNPDYFGKQMFQKAQRFAKINY